MGMVMCSALRGMEDVPRVATVPPSRIKLEYVFLMRVSFVSVVVKDQKKSKTKPMRMKASDGK